VNVDIYDAVTIVFDEDIDCTTVDTTNITSDVPGWTLSACAGTTASFSTSGQANSTVYIFTVTTAVTDLASNPIAADDGYSYTTTAGADTTPPTVAVTDPYNGEVDVSLNGITTIGFSENIDCATVNTTTITSDSPGWTFGACSNATATFSTAGQANTTIYIFTVNTGVTDVSGNAMDPL
jgi:hypothetical protein